MEPKVLSFIEDNTDSLLPVTKTEIPSCYTCDAPGCECYAEPCDCDSTPCDIAIIPLKS